MPSSSGHSKRKSFFGFSTTNDKNGTKTVVDGEVKKLFKKKGTSLSMAENKVPDGDQIRISIDSSASTSVAGPVTPTSETKSRRPSVGLKTNSSKPGSVFGSFISLRSAVEEEASQNRYPNSARSIHSNDVDLLPVVPQSRKVIKHGEVQTSSGMFRKKKEYLVLTDTCLVRCKNHTKATETYKSIIPLNARNSNTRHASSQSVSSTHEIQTISSDSASEKDGKIPLNQIVAIYASDDIRSSYALEVCFSDEDTNHASTMTMQFTYVLERDSWMEVIRSAVQSLRDHIAPKIKRSNLDNAVRYLERENDYDSSNFKIFKVIQKQQAKTHTKSSTDDLSKIGSTVSFLAIGIHKIHIIPLPRENGRTSAPMMTLFSPRSYGILTLSALHLQQRDDTFEITFRQPLKPATTLTLASMESTEIALQIRAAEHYLRPETLQRLYHFDVPSHVRSQISETNDRPDDDYCAFQRTLVAYCLSYDAFPNKINYFVNHEGEDVPRFELLPPINTKRVDYSQMELLSILRALRYNESFASISFAGIALDSLRNLYDKFGYEFVCMQTKDGIPLQFPAGELNKDSLLVQEIRALASTNKRLCRLDFSRCIRQQAGPDIGCGIVEAVLPLCGHQTTNVDKISLNGIKLSEVDLDYLIGAAADRACHLRALELGSCGLNDRSLNLILDALRAHENTLEILDISGNSARLSPIIFGAQISVFGFIRNLDLSNLARTSGSEALLDADTLMTWHLEVLKLSGVNVNAKTVDALAEYLSSPRSNTLKELIVDHASLTGAEIATLMKSVKRPIGTTSNLHFDISHNNIYKDHEALSDAFVKGYSPTHVTLRAMQYRDETILRNLFNAIRQNKSTRYLDISRISLPGDASEETASALQRLFAENTWLEELDISGEDSRLETSKFGTGLNRALSGLIKNESLQILRIQNQKLGVPGAGALAEVLRENFYLRELHCDGNEIPLSAFTDLVNSLHKNTTLIYLPLMDEGRAQALEKTEQQVKQIRDQTVVTPTLPDSPLAKATSHLGMMKGLAGVKRSFVRSTSAQLPTFPSLTPVRGSHVSPTNRSDSLPKNRSSTMYTLANGSSAQLSEQDIMAALRLVAESWDRQQYRLQQYLQRNWSLLHGIDVPMDIQEEEFERPISVMSLNNVIDKVKIDSTPTIERLTMDFQPLEISGFTSDLNLMTGEPVDIGDGDDDETGLYMTYNPTVVNSPSKDHHELFTTKNGYDGNVSASSISPMTVVDTNDSMLSFTERFSVYPSSQVINSKIKDENGNRRSSVIYQPQK